MLKPCETVVRAANLCREAVERALPITVHMKIFILINLW